MSYINIYTDGGSRGNPGPSASAFVVISEKGSEISSGSSYLGDSTNNQAEYSAVLISMNWLKKYVDKNQEVEEIRYFLDSELVVKQLNGIYRTKDEKLKKIAFQITEVRRNLKPKITFTAIPREKNKQADLLVNKTLDNN
jgi:ribonuclease HI